MKIEPGTRVLATVEAEVRLDARGRTGLLYVTTDEGGVHSLPQVKDVEILRRPKPEEPTGLGAVVEDAEGKVFVRIPDGDDHDVWFDNRGDFYAYEQIKAVRVLSEGVQV